MSIENDLYKELTDRIMLYHPTRDFSMLETHLILPVVLIKSRKENPVNRI